MGKILPSIVKLIDRMKVIEIDMEKMKITYRQTWKR
jgi:hypothetical protein